MDILYNDINRIKVSIYQEGKKQCILYLSEEECYNSDKYVTICENKDTYIMFECSINDAKLYMDGLETIEETIIKEDNSEEVYISPSSEKILLYNKDRFPLIPGFFRIVIKVDRDIYYSRIKVNPKYLEESELADIKDDLEKEINGLAFELIKKNIAIGEFHTNNLPIKLYKFFIIHNRFSNIMSAIEDLKIRPNYKISKRYKMVKEDEIKSIDDITIKSYLEGKIRNGFLKQPITELDYNLPENQWVKKILKEVYLYLEEFIEESQNLISKKNEYLAELRYYRANESIVNSELNTIKYLNNLIESASKMKNSINGLNTVWWFENISYNFNISTPHTLFYDARYNCIYKLYMELKNNDFSITLNNKYAFQWKRTDKLYEMWCFIKISKIIMGPQLLFNATKGWIFDQEIRSNKILIPELHSGSKISFNRNDIRLNLVYDEKMPHNGKNTSIEEMPIFITRSNNRPDGRIDIYIKKIYIGSIILEFKYRDRRVLWYEDYIKYQNKKESNVIKQLTAYGNNCKSLHLFKGIDDSEGNTDIYPIKKVLIFYPKSNKKITNVDEIKDHNLKFIKFTPGSLNNKIENEVVEAIEELIERAKKYGFT